MHFQWNNHQYDITVSASEAPYPKEGLPVLYVLDGAHNGVLVNEMRWCVCKCTCENKNSTYDYCDNSTAELSSFCGFYS